MKQYLCCLLFAAGALFSAPAQPASDATVQALLAEVRQLRQALEKSALVAPRIQVTLQRMQLQQESVARASREILRVREALAKAANEESGFEAEVKGIHAAAAKETDPTRRATLEGQAKTIQRELEQTRNSTLQLRAAESELAGVLRAEQGKLDELQARLDALERLLDPQSAK